MDGRDSTKIDTVSDNAFTCVKGDIGTVKSGRVKITCKEPCGIPPNFVNVSYMLIVLHFCRFCKRKMQDFKKSRQNSRNIHFFKRRFFHMQAVLPFLAGISVG